MVDFFSCGKRNTCKMYCFGALALLNIVVIHLTSGKPFENRGRLHGMENSHRNYGDLRNGETEAHSNFNAFLENLKANFLRSLNLTEIPSQEKMKEEPPQFMIDLYNRYTKDKSSSPISNIVRSFSPEGMSCFCIYMISPGVGHCGFLGDWGNPNSHFACSISQLFSICMFPYKLWKMWSFLGFACQTFLILLPFISCKFWWRTNNPQISGIQ